MDFQGSVGYLIHELAQMITLESDQVLLERFGIGFSQYKVLVTLQMRQGVPQKSIARSLSQTEASVSRQIGVLIDKDLVEIGPSKDNRQHLIYLTTRGSRLVDRSTGVLNDHYEPFFGRLSERDLSKLRELLLHIRGAA